MVRKIFSGSRPLVGRLTLRTPLRADEDRHDFGQILAQERLQFWQQYRDNYITEADIKFLHDTGFNSIRIPFHYKFFAAGNDEGFRRLDSVIGWAAKDHLYVILDMHCAPGGQTGANIDDSWGYPWLYDPPPTRS